MALPTIPKFALKSRPPKTIVRLANGIGNVVLVWGLLEASIDYMLGTLMKLEKDDKVFWTLVNNIDFRGKVAITKGLAYLNKPNDQWFDALKDMLDRSDNILRPERNKIIHGLFIPTEDYIKHVTRRTGFKKPQAFQTTYYEFLEKKHDAKEIKALQERIATAAFAIVLYAILFRSASQKVAPPEGPAP